MDEPKPFLLYFTGVMTVKAETLQNFIGVVHSRDFRKPECSGYGENSKVTYLRINMLADKDDKDYCGVFTQVGFLASIVPKNGVTSKAENSLYRGEEDGTACAVVNQLWSFLLLLDF